MNFFIDKGKEGDQQPQEVDPARVASPEGESLGGLALKSASPPSAFLVPSPYFDALTLPSPGGRGFLRKELLKTPLPAREG